MILLQARNITAGYGDTNVLNCVSLEVMKGEIVGLIGLNGCGKSTLLRVLSGVLPAREGDVRLCDRDLGSWTALDVARRLAFVPQQEPANFDFTVRDIVLMGRYPYRRRFRGDTDDDFARVTAALVETDLLHLAERPVTQLSGGEHRRVLLARALAQETSLMLLDEPTAHLDVTHQFGIMQIIRTLACERGMGALAALHDLNQAAEFCDRLILLDSGRVVAEGVPEAVVTASNLLIAYGAVAQVGRNEVTGRPLILTLRPARGSASSRTMYKE